MSQFEFYTTALKYTLGISALLATIGFAGLLGYTLYILFPFYGSRR
jgi:hypothetical protein